MSRYSVFLIEKHRQPGKNRKDITFIISQLMDKQEQIKEWSRLYGRQITEEEYREICGNLKGLFGILSEWNKEPINEV